MTLCKIFLKADQRSRMAAKYQESLFEKANKFDYKVENIGISYEISSQMFRKDIIEYNLRLFVKYQMISDVQKMWVVQLFIYKTKIQQL
ncbi:unnamed protein product [Paramecium sonneborni]|uniref:Uncharacterized protein n=1 Tax=Paramecium sonneborni TaxID=65129 RepID=A0A8S1RHT9_9CILI|nr:unnamed protein product [Paramecium sonneborni]